MPSFDIVSEIDMHETQNAVDQAKRDLTRRWDFKGVDASYELKESVVNMAASEEFQIEQMKELLETALAKRGIKVGCLEYSDIEGAGKQVRCVATLRQGIDKPLSKNIVKKIKDTKLKVQSSIQGEMVRVTGKKRDELQDIMQLLKSSDDIVLPLQFKNFKD
jgi:uncharacterized protein YajQ (UPF0234 family)